LEAFEDVVGERGDLGPLVVLQVLIVDELVAESAEVRLDDLVVQYWLAIDVTQSVEEGGVKDAPAILVVSGA